MQHYGVFQGPARTSITSLIAPNTMHYAVFRGTDRPSSQVKPGDVIEVTCYEQLYDRFLRLQAHIDYIECLPDARTIKGTANMKDVQYKVVLHLSDRSPGNDSIRLFEVN